MSHVFRQICNIYELYHHDEEVPGSSLRKRSGYPERSFVIFLSFSRQMSG
jgi:hypothetical protein